MFNRNQSLPYILLKNKRHCDLFLEFIVFSRSSEVRFVQISVISSGFCRFGFRMYTFSCGTVLLPSKISSSCRSDYLYANSFFIVTVTTYFITNNAYRIMHYIPRNVSVRPHQVSHCVRTFDAVLRNNLYRFFHTMHIFIQLFYSIASNVWCFLQIFIFPQLFNTPVWRTNAVVVREVFRSLRLTNIAIVQ